MVPANQITIKSFKATAVVDVVLQLIDDAKKIDTNLVPSLIFMDFTQFEQMDTKEAMLHLQNSKNFSWGVLQGIRDEMVREFNLNQQLLLDAYTKPIESIDGFTGEVSAKDLVNYIEYLKLRLRRSMCYMNPEFTFTKSTNPSTKAIYELIKAYWIDDDGTRSRAFNKTMGNHGLNMELLNVKMFETLGYIANNGKRINGVELDILLSKGNEKWVVEVKHQVKQNYIDAFATIELWKHYKLQYGIQ